MRGGWRRKVSGGRPHGMRARTHHDMRGSLSGFWMRFREPAGIRKIATVSVTRKSANFPFRPVAVTSLGCPAIHGLYWDNDALRTTLLLPPVSYFMRDLPHAGGRIILARTVSNCFIFARSERIIKDTRPTTNTTRGGRKAHRPTPKTRIFRRECGWRLTLMD